MVYLFIFCFVWFNNRIYLTFGSNLLLCKRARARMTPFLGAGADPGFRSGGPESDVSLWRETTPLLTLYPNTVKSTLGLIQSPCKITF